jgi:hypothetical protein
MYRWRTEEKRGGRLKHLEQVASSTLLGLTFLDIRGGDNDADSLVEHGLETLLGEGRALHVLDGSDFLGHLHALLVGDGGLTLGTELLNGLLVLAKIELGTSEDDGGVGAVVRDLREPLGANVLEGGRVDDRVSDQEDISLGVGQGTKAIVILLTSSIPKTKVDGLAVDHDVSRVIVKDGGDVLTGEGVCSVRDQQTSLTDGSVSNNLSYEHGRIAFRWVRRLFPTNWTKKQTHAKPESHFYHVRHT